MLLLRCIGMLSDVIGTNPTYRHVRSCVALGWEADMDGASRSRVIRQKSCPFCYVRGNANAIEAYNERIKRHGALNKPMWLQD